MRTLRFLGPGVKFDARSRYGKNRAEYVFWSPDAREAPHGVAPDPNGNVAPRGDAGKAREVTNEEADDLLTFPQRSRMDFRFEEVTGEAGAEPEPVPIAAPRSPEEVTAEVARELAVTQEAQAEPDTRRPRRAGAREDT